MTEEKKPYCEIDKIPCNPKSAVCHRNIEAGEQTEDRKPQKWNHSYLRTRS